MSKLFKILTAAFLLAAAFSCGEKLPPVNENPGNTDQPVDSLPPVDTLPPKDTIPENIEPAFERFHKEVKYPTTNVGWTASFALLLPQSYETDLEKEYPVVYMLHGYGDSGRDWSEWVEAIKAIENSGLQEMIYVFPNCGNSYYSNYYNDSSRRYMDLVTEDLVPYIDANYRTIADREHRAVMGYSMGGFGAMVLPLKNPEIFSISIPLSMSFRTDEQYMAESQSGWDNQWGKIFGGRGQSGEGRLTDYYKEHCPFYQFVPENHATLSTVKWFFHCGDNEEQLLIANDNLHVQMRDYGFDHEFRIGDGGHSGSYWRSAAKETLPWVEHVMKGGGKWTKTKEVSLKSSTLNEDGSFSSTKFKDNPQDGGLAVYFAHNGYSDDLMGKAIGLLSQSGQIFPYMILPCDLNVKSLADWMAEYTEKYGIGGNPAQSHVIAFGDAGREAYELKDQFSAYYFVDADLAEDESTIVADADKRYYIDQTDDSANYRDMNAMYRACKFALTEDGGTDEADFEYRMRNGIDDKEQEMLLAVESLATCFKYK